MNANLKIRSGGAWIETTVEVPESATLLDALETARTGGAPGLRYRHSCHHGSCGTCGALVNGKPRLLCLSPLAEYASGVVTLEPLTKQERIGDLAVLPAPLFRSLPAGASYLRPSDAAPTAILPSDGAPVDDEPRASAHIYPFPPSNGRRTYDELRLAPDSLPESGLDKRGNGAVRFESCVECGLCVEACPVEGPFSGPAALAMANREIEKRPAEGRRFLEFAAGPDGAAACERRFECSRACPLGVAPGRHIQALRNRMAP